LIVGGSNPPIGLRPPEIGPRLPDREPESELVARFTSATRPNWSTNLTWATADGADAATGVMAVADLRIMMAPLEPLLIEPSSRRTRPADCLA
jgi:hypothetical protein